MGRKFLSILLLLCVLLSFGVTTNAEEGENLIPGANFEALDQNGNIVGAIGPLSTFSPLITVENSEARGGNVLHIIDEDAVNKPNNPYVQFRAEVIPGAEYQLDGWLYKDKIGSESYIGIKFEYYDRAGNHVAGHDELRKFGSNLEKGVWTKIEQQYTVPLENIAEVGILFRLYGTGDVYYDDMSFRMTKEATHFTADSGFFYYRDETEGKATVRLNTISYPEIEGNRVDIKLMDGETVLSETSVAAQTDIVWYFSTLCMTEVEKSYTLRVEYFSQSGSLLERQDKEVLIYNRPKNLTKEGYVLDNAGNVIHPVLGYHAWPSSYGKVKKEVGINVQQCVYQSSALTQVKAALDKAEDEGVMLLVPLYAGMKPAGHPDNQLLNKTCIDEIKTHNALLGYMVMDEPFGHEADAGGTEGMYQWLQDSYKFIRQHDKDHLIYICENDPESYGLAASTCDLLAIDPYVGTHADARGDWVYQYAFRANEATEGRKPLWTVVQAWRWIGEGGGWLPDGNDIRSFLYQALLAGSQGIGYYRVDDLGSDSDDTLSMWEYDYYPSLKSFNETEWEDAKKAFITGEYPTFAHNTDEASPVWYKLFVKGSDIYAVLLNRENNENTVSIPLTSFDGSVTIGSFSAVAADVSGAPAISGAGTLTATLSEAQVVRYKLTVSEDLSGLTTSKFRDIYNYGWAKEAIDSLYQKGIANAKGISRFAPSKPITRGDFAMFLIRTLGLSAEGGDNFADVSPNAEYADAIRVGRALGILKGTDGGNYLPETPISRQAFMENCARAMYRKEMQKAGGNASADSMAAYAVDIATMMREDIPYEKVEFTENATRAEAAVIMQYILDWDEGNLASEFSSLSQAERSDVLSLLLSEGSVTDEVWKAEEDGMIAVYNGSDAEKEMELEATAPYLRYIYGEGEAALSDGTVSGWEFTGGEWGDTFFLPDEAYAGGGAMGIRTGGNAYVSQTVQSLVAGRTYTLKARLKTVSGSTAIKTEFFKNNAWHASGTQADVGSRNGEWNEVSYSFTVPEGANRASLLLRVIGGGEAYWDSLTLSDGETDIPITNSGFEASTGGVLTLTIPAKTHMILFPVYGVLQGVEKDNIIYERLVSGAAVRCTSDTWAAQYVYENGIKEMIGFFVNGDTLREEIGELSFFRWDAMLRPKE
ncbi:MAG: S-layer homology domain-containing protein [Ruminococcaceae bacterium]|nr:S-layer homology domain-containing protein [Oscillospiraceae bacterium]